VIWRVSDISLQARSNTDCLCADKVNLKQKATGMGTPAAFYSRLIKNYAVKWRRAHTDCSETTTDAIFNIKNEPPFCNILMINREKFITAVLPGQADSACASDDSHPSIAIIKLFEHTQHHI
jgi:hypothetical protein